MLREHASVFKRLMQVADVAIVCGSFYASYYLLGLRGHELKPLVQYVLYIPVMAAIWLLFFNFYGMYWSFRTEKIPTILFIVFETVGLSVMTFGAILYILKVQDMSRALVLGTFIGSGIVTGIEKTALILSFRRIREQGRNFRNLLIIGSNKRAQKVINLIDNHNEWGLRIVGILDEDLGKRGETVHGHYVIGSMIDLPEIIHNNVIDEVIFVVPRSWLSQIEDVIIFLETEGIRVHISEDFFNLRHSRLKQTDLYGLPMLTIESTPDKIWQLYFKRMVDLTLSGLALVILSPVFLVIAALIKLTSPGHVIFNQERVGRNGRRFFLYKFRIMEKDAEKRLKEFSAKNEMKGPVFKLANLPRVTPVGKWLRKLSLDELPQLWNVFKGDMSLVGPRPPLPSEVNEYDSWHRRHLSMNPGITCIWQCSGRNRIVDFDEWAKLDLEYIDTWSFWLDVKILLKTIPAVLFGVGAK
ncbi:MAG: sugar transferase [Deltaproteobacteria bacterium]